MSDKLPQTDSTKQIQVNYPTEIDFLQQTINVLNLGDKDLIESHLLTCRVRMENLKAEIEHPQIIEAYQNKIDSKIKSLFHGK